MISSCSVTLCFCSHCQNTRSTRQDIECQLHSEAFKKFVTRLTTTRSRDELCAQKAQLAPLQSK